MLNVLSNEDALTVAIYKEQHTLYIAKIANAYLTALPDYHTLTL